MRFEIGQVRQSDWPAVVDLIAEGVGNVIMVKLGKRFARIFYRYFASQDYSCVYVARSEEGKILGVIIGTLDHRKAYREAVASQRLELLAAANIRFLSPSFLAWFVKGVKSRFVASKNILKDDGPKARLVVISLCPQARGMGLAAELVSRMESFFISKNLNEPYLVLTEKNNVATNRFYGKIGADFVRTNIHHGRAINHWHKNPVSKDIDE